MKKTILISLFIISGFVFLTGQTITSLGITGTYYDIRSDNNGKIHIIWMDNGWMKYGQIVNRQVVNPVTIPGLDRNEVVYKKFRPRLAVKPDGSEIHFVWVNLLDLARDMMHCWRDSGGTWRKEKIYTSTKYIQYPTFTVDSSATLHASCMEWVSTSNLHPVIYYRKGAAGTWTRETNLAPATAQHLWNNLFTDTNGNVHIYWDKNKSIPQYRSAGPDGNLATSPTVSLPLGAHSKNKQGEVFADSAGNVYVAALSYDDPGTKCMIDYWIKPAGGSFSAPVSVSGGYFDVWDYFPFPSVLARSPDMVAVSWAEKKYNTNPATIRVATFNGTGWTIYTLSTTGNFKQDTRTSMAMDDETAYLIWRESDGTISLATFDYAVFGVLSPNGGETWEGEKTYDIRWNLENATGNVDINLYKNNVNLGPIVSDISDTGTYSWTINTLESSTTIQKGTDYKVQVRAVNGSDSDISNAVFTIDDPFQLTSPVSSSVWSTGQTYNITWTTPLNASSAVKVNIFKGSIDTANFVEQLTGPNNGSLSWTIADTYEPGNYIIRLKTDDNLLISDSDVFTIETGTPPDPQIIVTAPAAGATWFKGSTYSITWTRIGSQADNVNIYIYLNSVLPGNLIQTLSGANSGSFSWAIPGTYTDGNYIIRVQTDDGTVTGDSGVFTISYNTSLPPSMTITSPSSGDEWIKGSTHDIIWERTGTLSANVKINIFRNSVDVANFVQQLTGPNSGSCSWTIPADYVSGNYVIRIKTDDNLVLDDSDVFSVTEGTVDPTITVNTPSAGATWYKGSAYTIGWTSSGEQTANVNIDIYRDSVSPSNFVEQITTANDGSHSWMVPGTYADGNYVIHVETTDAAVYGDSGVFAIAESSSVSPSITITSPTSSDIWYKGSNHNITWTKTGTQSDNVKINIFKDTIDVAGFIEQISGPNTGSLTWDIPSSYASGNYILRIKTGDNLLIDDSDMFTIAESSPVPPSITVLSPNPCSTWFRGGTYTITWLKEGSMSGSVIVNIFKDSITEANFLGQLTGPNTGSLTWTIPNDFAGGNYVLRIKTDDNLVLDDSEVFAVSTATVPSPNITVTSPNSCDAWKKLKTYTIAWSKTGSMSANVKINIFRGSIAVENFVEQLTGPNTGSISWTVPGSYTTGTYVLRIKTDDNLVLGDSGYFEVEN